MKNRFKWIPISINGSPRHLAWKRYEKLFERLGRPFVENRLYRQTRYRPKLYQMVSGKAMVSETSFPLYQLFFWLLVGLRCYDQGTRNTLKYTVTHVTEAFEDLPEAFDGLRILQITDLHAPSIPDGGEVLCGFLKDVKCDLCVITGDFHLGAFGFLDDTLRVTRKIIDSVKATLGIWGILGNHDPIELVYELEDMGCRMLVNESAVISRNGSSVGLAGIDDPHFFKSGDVASAVCRLPKDIFRILLSHSPEVYEQAEKAGIRYMLCGHTHGGQVRLAPGLPYYANARCPRSLVSGSWRYCTMKGYTSNGVGSSAVPVRFFCPPEITLHRLVRDKKDPV
jgi:hypothetical protein